MTTEVRKSEGWRSELGAAGDRSNLTSPLVIAPDTVLAEGADE